MGLRSLFWTDKGKQQRKDREREEQLALTNRLSQIVFSSWNPGQLCRGFSAELKELMSIDCAAIALIDENTRTVRLSPLSANVSSAWESGDAVPLMDSPVAWVAENKRGMVEPDLKRRRQFRTGTSYIEQGIRSVVYMPLFSRREVFGSLIVGSRRSYAYGERELRLLKYATAQLAMAIESFRIYRESQVGAKWQADFIAAIKHELKTPLTPIISDSDLLTYELEKQSLTAQARLARSVARSAYTLDRKITDLLQLAKLQIPDFELKLVKLDISSVLEDVAAQLVSYLEPMGQSLDLKLSNPLPMIRADTEYLMQVLLTLLTIASELSPEGGNIELRANGVEKELVVEVRDSGPGFSKEDQKELMSPYSFAEAERQRFPKFRLRLTVVRLLVQRHGGRLWLESEPGKGSTFSFSLPIAKD